ncbi:unnamed protein product [Paramecium primaurelia]|uniref:Transmembrane protein n=1 Tax=Paramecium primaurelia TaxID=5886 RepID=A0A8S1MLA8_PARPR|nr:unnamed protein product [Paramecium primaurelia]
MNYFYQQSPFVLLTGSTQNSQNQSLQLLLPENGRFQIMVGLFQGINYGVSPIPQFLNILLYVDIPEKDPRFVLFDLGPFCNCTLDKYPGQSCYFFIIINILYKLQLFLYPLLIQGLSISFSYNLNIYQEFFTQILINIQIYQDEDLVCLDNFFHYNDVYHNYIMYTNIILIQQKLSITSKMIKILLVFVIILTISIFLMIHQFLKNLLQIFIILLIKFNQTLLMNQSFYQNQMIVQLFFKQAYFIINNGNSLKFKEFLEL